MTKKLINGSINKTLNIVLDLFQLCMAPQSLINVSKMQVQHKKAMTKNTIEAM